MDMENAVVYFPQIDAILKLAEQPQPCLPGNLFKPSLVLSFLNFVNNILMIKTKMHLLTSENL